MFSNIFNNNQQTAQPQNSLFGQQQPQNQQPPGGGGLFGAQASLGGGGGGLFGGPKPNNPAPGGGLFGNLLGGNTQPQNNNNSFMTPSNPPATGGIFGGLSNSQQPPNNNAGGGLFGAGGFGGANAGFPMGGNNNQPQGMGFGAQPQAGGGLFGAQQNNAQPAGGLFGTTGLGGNAMGGGLFGANANNTQQPQTGGLFGNVNQNNNAGGFGGASTGLGLATTPSFNLGNQQAGGMMVGGGGAGAGAGGTIGTPFDRAQTRRGNENCWVQSINAMSVYKDKHLYELRLEDYKAIREGRLPDEMKMLLQNGQSLANYQPKAGGGGFNLGGASSTPLGGNSFFGPSPQTQSAGGGLFGASTLSTNKPASTASGGLFGNTPTPNTGFFGGVATNATSPNTPLFGGGASSFGQPQPAPTTSIFGGAASNTFNANAPKPNNMFGNLTTPTTGGLLGTPAQGLGTATPSGGLFGNQPTTGGVPNTFGQNFMNKPGDNQPPTGLFGGLTGNSTQPTGGLFGNQPQMGGLFGQPQQAQGGLFQAANFGGNSTGTVFPQQQAGLAQQNPMGGVPMMGGQQQAMGGLMYQNDPYNANNLSVFASGQLFSNSPTQNNWLYHDWNREYQNFYGQNYEENDDLGFFPYNPYKKTMTHNTKNPLFKNLTISRKPEYERHHNQNSFEGHRNPLMFEKKVSSNQEERKPKEFIDKEPNLIGYQQNKLTGPTKPQPNIREKEENTGFAADKQRIQELLDPTIRLMVELKGPKQGLFSLDCELDVTIGEMKDQILEILEKNIGKSFISQGKFYKIMITTSDKGFIVLNENKTIEQYGLKNNQTITLIKDLNLEDEAFIQAENQVNKYHYQLAPESMIPVLTKQGYSLEPSLRQLSRMNEEQLKKVENFTIRNEFATVRFEGLTDVRNLNIDKIVNFSFKSVELYPEEVYTEENKPSRGKELNKPALIVFHKFKIEETERVTREKIIKKVKHWTQKSNMEFINFDFDHGNLTTRVPYF